MTTVADKLTYLHVNRIGDCTRCALHRKRNKIVFGEGSPTADIMFVGEAPGANEDRTGRPFCGRSGDLLDQWIKRLGLERKDVYIANTVKCRPEDNRDPFPQEKSACAPFLHTQIWLIKPKVLVALGRHAANSLAKAKKSMKDLRSEPQFYEHPTQELRIPLVPVFHPSYVLRKGRGETEQEALEDLRKAWTLAGLSTPPR